MEGDTLQVRIGDMELDLSSHSILEIPTIRIRLITDSDRVMDIILIQMLEEQ